MVQQLYGLVLANHPEGELPIAFHQFTCEQHTLARWAEVFVSTRTQGLNLNLTEDSLVNRMEKDIQSILTAKGSTHPMRPVILALIFHYWLFYANPHYPRQFLVPSLYIADDMKRQEAAWLKKVRDRIQPARSGSWS